LQHAFLLVANHHLGRCRVRAACAHATRRAAAKRARAAEHAEGIASYATVNASACTIGRAEGIARTRAATDNSCARTIACAEGIARAAAEHAGDFTCARSGGIASTRAEGIAVTSTVRRAERGIAGTRAAAECAESSACAAAAERAADIICTRTIACAKGTASTRASAAECSACGAAGWGSADCSGKRACWIVAGERTRERAGSHGQHAARSRAASCECAPGGGTGSTRRDTIAINRRN
jgi:hypothetical protein